MLKVWFSASGSGSWLKFSVFLDSFNLGAAYASQLILKFSVFLDSFLDLSWWKPLSYWVQTLYKSAISRKEPQILKPSSNSGLALASITGPATDPSHQMVQEFLYLNSRYGNRATFFRAKFLKFNDTCSRCACTILLIRRYKQWYHKKSILKFM